MKVLHVGTAGVFLNPFVDFISRHFDASDHRFLLATNYDQSLPERPNVVPLRGRWKSLVLLLREMHRADAIILHGLFDARHLTLLALQPRLLAKCCWGIWGGDLYAHVAKARPLKWRVSEFLKQRVVRRLGHITTHVRGDYELAQAWYGATGSWHECFLYPSNLHKESLRGEQEERGVVNVLLGNSATPSNRHMQAIAILARHAGKGFVVYCPLSYGDRNYAQRVIAAGRSALGSSFLPMLDFLPPDDYAQLQSRIHVAVFNHDRQQAVGNIVTFLGWGKKVYLRSEVTTAGFLTALGVTFFDVEEFDPAPLDQEAAARNRTIISRYFSEPNLREGWALVFSSISTERGTWPT